jgi:hypothetical protein
MTAEQPQGPFCQSCSMPIDQTDFRGTEADGSKSEKYCVYCYKDGQFLQPDATLDQMIEISAKGWAEQDPTVTYEQAKAQLEKVLPYLERWCK